MDGVAVILGDIHAPYHCELALRVAFKVIEIAKPDMVIWNGDIHDFYQLSRFDPDPERRLKLQADFDAVKTILCRGREAAPNAEMIYKEGNHEQRLGRWRNRNPEIGALDCMKLDALLDLPSIRCRLVDANQRLEWNGYTITHGDLCRRRGGATAQAMIDRFGTNGVSNHVHRFAQVEKRDALRSSIWIENGCLCSLQPEYTEVADWQHGLTVLTCVDGTVWPELVRIRDGRTRFRDISVVF